MAAIVESALDDLGVQLTIGGEPTYVPIHPDGPEWNITALGPTNVSVDVVYDPPWHPARISPEGKQKLGLS